MKSSGTTENSDQYSGMRPKFARISSRPLVVPPFGSSSDVCHSAFSAK